MECWPDKSPANGIDVDANAAKSREEKDLKDEVGEEGFGNSTNNAILVTYFLLWIKDIAVISLMYIFYPSHLSLKLHPLRYHLYKL